MDYKRLTYGFIHADTSHLIANIGGQLIFALLICLDIKEKNWIRLLKAILVYTVSILVGSIAFDYVPNKETCGLVGASAGVFGLCGLCAIEGLLCIICTHSPASPYTRNLIEYNNKLWTFVFAGVKLFLCLILIAMDVYYNLPTSSNGAHNSGIRNNLDTLYVHMGGFISGIILTCLAEVISYIFCCRKNTRIHSVNSQSS